MQPLKAFLQKLIPALPAVELDELLALWNTERTLVRGELLNLKGQVENYMYFVLEGTFRICYETEEQEIVVGFGYPGTLLQDSPSFLSGKPSKFYIEAIKAAKLIGIHRTDLYAFVEQNHTFATFWRKLIEQAVLAQIERETDLLTNSPQERYQRLKNRSPHVFQLIPNKHIASYLRMTPETLSRLKKR